MSGSLSLRGRVVLGAVLWTTGLFAVAGVVLTYLIYEYPWAPRVFHAPFLHIVPVSLGALACMLYGLVQVRRGLAGINQLHGRLAAVHDGRDRRVEGSYPAEVQPLVNDLNALLDHREQAIQRALAKAGDLAHGLKTPLALLTQEAERAAASGQSEVAAAIRNHVERMRRQVDYHLAHARAAASGTSAGARCSLKDAADGLARTLQRLHAAKRLAIDVNVSPAHTVRCQREDLDEMLGNLLDNACKWARGRVTLSSDQSEAAMLIVVEDDGLGIEPSKREAVLQRGVRADEAAPGSGLGLAIVRDLAELYGGSIALGSSPEGGVRAELRLPA